VKFSDKSLSGCTEHALALLEGAKVFQAWVSYSRQGAGLDDAWRFVREREEALHDRALRRLKVMGALVPVIVPA
jgi:hypothetical protein